MKVENRIITIQIDIDEWKEVKKEWDNIAYSDKPKKYDRSNAKSLAAFLDYIDMVVRNPSHKVDQKLNSL